MKSRKTVLKAKKNPNKTAKKLRKNKTLKKRIIKKKRKTLKKAGALEDSKLNIISGNEDDEARMREAMENLESDIDTFEERGDDYGDAQKAADAASNAKKAANKAAADAAIKAAKKAADAEDRSKAAKAMAAANKEFRPMTREIILGKKNFILDGTAASSRPTLQMKEELEEYYQF